jgi:hypothetical protein
MPPKTKEQREQEKLAKEFESSSVNHGVSMNLGDSLAPEPTLQNHEPQIDPIKMMQQSDQNAVRLGATLMKKEFKEGSEMIKDGQIVVDPNTGEPRKFSDTYYLELGFTGGSIRTKVSKELFDTVKEGVRYSCRGRIGEVRDFKNIYQGAIFTEFHYLYGNEEF